MLTYSYILAKQKLSWLEMWNEFIVLWKAKIFPKHGFFDSQFDKWLHKETFWHHVFYFWMTIFFSFFLKDAPFYFALVLAAWNWGNQVLWCNNIWIFLGCERGFGYDLIFFIYIVVETSNMGNLFFWVFKPKNGI